MTFYDNSLIALTENFRFGFILSHPHGSLWQKQYEKLEQLIKLLKKLFINKIVWKEIIPHRVDASASG